MAKISRQIIKKRRAQVYELYFVREYSIEEIVKVLKEWSASAIYNDIIELKKEGAELLGKADARMILKRIVDNRTKVVQRMWDVYDKAVKEGNLAVELKSLNDID